MALATHAPAKHLRWANVTVAIVFTAYMAVVFGLGLYLFSLLASEMRQTLGFGTQTIGAVTAAAQIAFLIAAFLCPRLTKYFGEGPVMVSAVIVSGGVLSAVSAVGSATSMAIFVGSLGACAAFMVIPTVGVITRTVDFRYRSRVNGLVSSGTAYGQLAAGSIAPWLVLNAGWRSVWLVLGIASVSVAVAGFVALKTFAPATFSKRIDADQQKMQRDRSAVPLFTRTNFLVWGLFATCGIACGPWQNYLSSFLGDESGFSISLIGRLWSVIGFVGLFSGFAVGMVADRIGIKRTLGSSFALLGGSAILVAIHKDAALLYVAAFCFGSSYFAVYGLIPAYISKTVADEQATSVFAGANICLGLGTALANLSSGYIPALSGSLQHVYICVAVVSGCATLLVIALPSESSGTSAP
ncbi:MFS transporter [Roseobacter sinensis]|uniref:MFS transporter n=1 Tax=Roseobacter sinensis TaxID=2931391 RepID=A0ABT3BLF4_9RHOB|nr:MFS transporter [Roseobacter sp. WL0113]MCV3274398.1 MFS transporter [Roseobacter sp. WL0113]